MKIVARGLPPRSRYRTNKQVGLTPMQLSDPLQSYLLSVRRMTGASSVSLLLSLTSRHDAPLTLFHDGDMPAVPELSGVDAARQLLADAEAGTEEDRKHGEARLVHAFRSTDAGGCLLRICITQVTERLTQYTRRSSLDERRTSGSAILDVDSDDTVWIGLQFKGRVPHPLLDEIEASDSDGNSGEPLPAANRLVWNLAFGIYMVLQARQLSHLLHDPVSRLPGRVEFRAHLKQALIETRRNRQPLGLALINPDDFGHINHRLGRESGDVALQEVAVQIQEVLRQSDVLFRYGGAVFGLIMRAYSAEEACRAAERVRLALSKGDLLEGAVRLTYSIGVVAYREGDQSSPQADVNELMRRADRALNAAKLSGGGCTVLWEPGGLASVVENLDRLSGIFTADTEKDYRNMLLLWDTVTVITSHADNQTVATQFVERLASTFKPQKLGLYEITDAGEHAVLARYQDQAAAHGGPINKAGMGLSKIQQTLLDRARQSLQTEHQSLSADGEGERYGSTTAYAVPLLARDAYLGCLYIDGHTHSFVLDSSDMIFLSALANQVAMALDRTKLALRWKQQKEHESRRLKQEVRGLRNALQHSRLVCRSPQMQSVLRVLRRIAPTDTTVLITGESGTGKEVLARTLHEQSPRHKQLFVTVDCGAIAQSLLEAELFGHVKGAFTGAQKASMGRIAQAEGGTLFLDEIGELPLEVQAKLLRFAQEKEFTPVGAERSRRVDVRIVAATNRDLAAESAAGTFRRDLYYRLQVVTLTPPPLRERPDDILPLAHYFLEKYAVQNDKSARRLSPEAEAALLRNPWTGNVRELQNRILQAVVMSDTEVIDWSHLGLNEASIPAQNHGNRSAAMESESLLLRDPSNPTLIANDYRHEASAASVPHTESPVEALRRELSRHVTQALTSGTAVPLGRWLISDLLITADAAVNGVARQASVLLGMAETTFRRQMDKVRRESLVGQSVRTSDWSALKPVFARIIATAQQAPGQNVIDQASRLLLEEVVAQTPHDDNLGSALLGVTKPTYQRRKAALHS